MIYVYWWNKFAVILLHALYCTLCSLHSFEMTYNVSSGTLNPTHTHSFVDNSTVSGLFYCQSAIDQPLIKLFYVVGTYWQTSVTVYTRAIGCVLQPTVPAFCDVTKPPPGFIHTTDLSPGTLQSVAAEFSKLCYLLLFRSVSASVRFCSQGINLAGWVTEWLIEYAIFFHRLAQQWRSWKKWNLAQR